MSYFDGWSLLKSEYEYINIILGCNLNVNLIMCLQIVYVMRSVTNYILYALNERFVRVVSVQI